MMPTRRRAAALTAALAVGAAGMLLAGRASADGGEHDDRRGAAAAGPAVNDPPGGWARLVAAPFTSPAGDLCRFALRSEPVFDQVYVRTTARRPDGSPRRQEYAGPLVVRLTNLATGRAVQRDLSGRAVARFAADGSYDFTIQGPAAVGFRSANGDSLPTGFYVLRGTHTVHFAAGGGPRTLLVDRGSEENVCRTLTAG